MVAGFHGTSLLARRLLGICHPALAGRLLLDQGSQAIHLTWLGDAANEVIACLLMSHGVQAFTGRLGVEIQRAGRSLDEIEDLLADISSEPAAPVDELLANACNLARQSGADCFHRACCGKAMPAPT